MTFSEFINHLAPEEVDTWWNDIAPNTVPEKAEDENWKYQLSKNGKSFPFKWTIKELATYYNINFNLKDFSSTDLTRNSFCDLFDFDIVEELVYNRTESNSLVDFYNSLHQTKTLLQEALDYLNKLILANQINPYKIRMATRDSNRQAMVIIGMRAVFAIREENDKVKLALILDKTIYENNRSNLNVKYEEQFKGKPDNKVLVSIEITKWDDIPKEILKNNTDEILLQYDTIKDSKRSSWNKEANTTNSALKYLIFKGENVEKWVISNKIIPPILNFKQAVEEYRIHLSNNSTLNARFKIMKCQKHFVFIYDMPNGFTNLECHYELITRDKLNIGIEIHFEESNKKEYLQQLKSELPEKVKIEEKHKKEGLSIAYETNYAITDKDLFYKIDKALTYLNENLGDKIFKIKTEMNKINLKDTFIKWFIENDGKNTNYFSQQFSSNADRLKSEINEYEEVYKNDFNTELFVIEIKSHKRQIEVIKANIYNKSLGFSEYSKNKSNDRPRAILGNKNYIKFLNQYFENNENPENNVNNNNNVKMELNQILYGPPGTGKTYSTINKALFILDPKNHEDLHSKNRKELKERFESYIKNEQIVFTTFHQSMSYEDFIEGIKPQTKNGKVTYAVEDGVFKSLVKKALVEYIRKEDVALETNSFDTLYNDFVKSIKPLEGKKEGTFTTKTGVEIMLVEASKTSIQVKYVWSNNKKEAEGVNIFTVSKEKLKKVLLEEMDPSKIKNLKIELHPLIGHIHCELFAVYKKFYEFVTTSKGVIETLHYDYDELSFEEVKEQFDLLSEDEIRQKVVKPYIIIIDEINRGNVSQIFGELITLIEEDKRLGKEEVIELTLPYSKEKFGVPSNVYIIGTMNTADRSVEALDAALRRRFCFEEMPPLYNLDGLQNDIAGYQVSQVLKTINSRIEKLIDKDHAIGHSYLLNKDKDSVVDSFYKNIIPLLQEYFFGDYGKLGLVLGKGFVHLKHDDHDDIFAYFNDAPDDFENRNVYKIIDYRKDEVYTLPINKVEVVMNFEKAIKVLMKGNIE